MIGVSAGVSPGLALVSFLEKCDRSVLVSRKQFNPRFTSHRRS
jgi:hypothetical protein